MRTLACKHNLNHVTASTQNGSGGKAAIKGDVASV